MEENINNIVEEAEQQLFNAADNLDKAIAETAAQSAQTVQPSTQPEKGVDWTRIVTDGALVLGGIGIGFAADRWGVPAVNKLIDNLKAKREKRKAERKAKKAAKAAAKNPAVNKPADAPATNDGIDPATVDTNLDKD